MRQNPIAVILVDDHDVSGNKTECQHHGPFPFFASATMRLSKLQSRQHNFKSLFEMWKKRANVTHPDAELTQLQHWRPLTSLRG
jgi:hypothetical protein